jgi:hypothetical protein
MACEGALLAHDIARGKTTVYFAREQAEELRIQSSNLADALAKRLRRCSVLRTSSRVRFMPFVRLGGSGCGVLG